MPFKNKCASNRHPGENGTEEKNSSVVEHMINLQKNSPHVFRQLLTTE